MTMNVSWLLSYLPKIKTIVLVVVLLSLASCSKVQYQEACIPTLKYELPSGTPFTLMNMIDAPKNYISNKGLKARIAFHESAEIEDANDPTNADYGIVHIESSYIFSFIRKLVCSYQFV